ncbi:hypothetical protein D3C80_596470 [compost metagenome]
MLTEQIKHVGAVFRQGFVRLWCAGGFSFRQQREIQQPVGVIVGWPQHLSAGQVLVNCRDAALQSHIFCRQRFADRQARQSGTIGAQQENGLDQIAARLLDGQRRQLRIVDAALGHDPVHGQPQLLLNLQCAQFRHAVIAAPQLFL